MKPDLRTDYKIRLYTRPKNPFFKVSTFLGPASEYIELFRKVLPHAPRMSHIVTNVNIELDGDHACPECYFLPSHGGIRSKSF